MKLAEVIQALSICVGMITTVVGAVVIRMRMASAREIKRLDVSSEWQSQMLARITAVEAELRAERVRSDQLERESYEWRSSAAELEWELKRTRSERFEMNGRIDSLTSENAILQRQNNALAQELREMHRQIRGGFQGLSVPPAAPKSPKK